MLSILEGQSGSELVGWPLREGQRWLHRAGAKERGRKGLQGRHDQSVIHRLRLHSILCAPAASRGGAR